MLLERGTGALALRRPLSTPRSAATRDRAIGRRTKSEGSMHPDQVFKCLQDTVSQKAEGDFKSQRYLEQLDLPSGNALYVKTQLEFLQVASSYDLFSRTASRTWCYTRFTHYLRV
jgi:hypothetical protein